MGGLKPDERYYYRFETQDKHSPVGRFQTALPADSNRPVKFAFFSCGEYTHGYFNGYDLMSRDDLDFVVCLGDYIYGEAYHSKAGGTGVRDDAHRQEQPAEPGHRARGADARQLPRQVRALPLRQDAARPARQVPDGRHLGRPRSPGQLRRQRGRRRPGREQALLGRAPPRGLQGLLRGDAVLLRGRQPHLPLRPARPQRRPDPARPAPVPRRPAVRRRGVRAVRGLEPAAQLPGPQADGLGQAAPARARRRAGRSSAPRR